MASSFRRRPEPSFHQYSGHRPVPARRKGRWLRVWDLSRQIEKQKEANTKLKARNDSLDAEVRDLKQGYAAIEERARSELGMVKRDEVFYQVMENAPAPREAPPQAQVPATNP